MEAQEIIDSRIIPILKQWIDEWKKMTHRAPYDEQGNFVPSFIEWANKRFQKLENLLIPKPLDKKYAEDLETLKKLGYGGKTFPCKKCGRAILGSPLTKVRCGFCGAAIDPLQISEFKAQIPAKELPEYLIDSPEVEDFAPEWYSTGKGGSKPRGISPVY